MDEAVEVNLLRFVLHVIVDVGHDPSLPEEVRTLHQTRGGSIASTRFPSPMWFRGASIRSSRFTGSFRAVCFGWTGPHAEPAPHLDADVSGAEFESVDVYAHAGRGLVGLTGR